MKLTGFTVADKRGRERFLTIQVRLKGESTPERIKVKTGTFYPYDVEFVKLHRNAKKCKVVYVYDDRIFSNTPPKRNH